MRRTITLLLALTLLFALPGCDNESNADTSLDSNRAFIHYGGMEKACATEDTVYFTSGDLVHYYDKTTGISGVLCGKAECEHSTAVGSGCNAYINSISLELQVYNQRIYWIRMDDTVQIRSMALDGTDHRIDRTVERGFLSSHSGNRAAILHRGALYIWIEDYTIVNGEEVMSLDMAAVPLDPDEEPYMIFQEEMSDIARRYHPTVTMQGYQDDIYIITSAAGSYGGGPDGDPDFYDLQIRRYNAVTRELTTLYHDSESPINYTVEMWAMDDGIIFFGADRDASRIFKFDFESAEITALSSFDYGNVQIADNLVVCSRYTSEQSNPTNPWGLTLAPQDIERSGEFHVVIRNFAGDVLVDDTYPLSGFHLNPMFCGNDGTYAYFISWMGYNENDGSHTRYMSLIGVALDGSGMEVLSSQEESYKYTGTHGSRKSSITLDDGTTIIVNSQTITVIPGDGGETVTMTVEELLEKGYQP